MKHPNSRPAPPRLELPDHLVLRPPSTAASILVVLGFVGFIILVVSALYRAFAPS